MSRPIIEVRGVSKRYQLGRIGFTSLRAELERWWSSGKNGRQAAGAQDFWALREVSFDVQRGEVIGIIGRNGAGKSTLLKILSEITEPTTGEIRLRGRTASLLEVGTGFHPELSGRENIFLNGAILGMRRAEIARKFDEIVAFAEVDQFIDTPVKRYSSGMYVRLAFAVAAHLEPEILIVDEVLAVGDQSFQQKCLGKMQDVARQEGRTVLFVSHNMGAVSRLCATAVHLDGGKVSQVGNAREVVAQYLNSTSAGGHRWARPAEEAPPPLVGFAEVAVVGKNGVLAHTEPVTVAMQCDERGTTAPWLLRASIVDAAGNEVLCSWDIDTERPRRPRPGRRVRASCTFPGALLRPGCYTVTVSACEVAGDKPVRLFDERANVVRFEISAEGYSRRADGGLVAPRVEWREEAATEGGGPCA